MAGRAMGTGWAAGRARACGSLGHQALSDFNLVSVAYRGVGVGS